MSGNEKAEEHFDDDFELDDLDEASWGDDDAAAGEGFKSSEGDTLSSDEGGAVLSAAKKKSGGGFFTGLIVLALLGGGSFYAYQSGLIPGLSPQNAPQGQNFIPAPTGEDENASQAASDEADETITALADSDSPPMPEIQNQDDSGGASDGLPAVDMESEQTLTITSDDPGQQDTPLTPMPGTEGSDDLELAPLDLGDEEIEIAQVAEKDGMLGDSAEDAAETSGETASSGGLLESGGMAVPGGEDEAEALTQTVGEDELTDLDEAALLGETEKVPEAADKIVEDVKEAVSADISDELGLTPETDEPEAAELNVTSEDAEAPLEEAKEEPAVVDAPVTESAVTEKTESSQTTVSPVPQAEEKAPETGEPEKGSDSEKQQADSVEAASTPPKAVEPVKPVVLPLWVLKSAKPGMAVLYDKRTGDVKTVEVGDRVSGLGRIKSVSKVDGKWVVDGTTGKVKQ